MNLCRTRAVSRKKKMSVIRTFVLEQRKRLGIAELKGPLPELSCTMHGEFHNLLWRGLMHTPESRWHELRDREILDGAYREVLRQLGSG